MLEAQSTIASVSTTLYSNGRKLIKTSTWLDFPNLLSAMVTYYI